MCEAIEDFDDMDKLCQGFTSADPLEKIDIGDGTISRPTFVNKNLSIEYKADLINLLKEYIDCFAWEYHEMSGLSCDLVEHRLPIIAGFRPYKASSSVANNGTVAQQKRTEHTVTVEPCYQRRKMNCVFGSNKAE